MSSLSNDLELALELADLADQQSMQRYLSQDLEISTKPDQSPVTDADKSTERAIRDHLAKKRPLDSIIGEEFGNSGGSNRTWIIDPIDGTANFLRGVPVWATLISLRVGENYDLGVVSAPALKRRWWAATGMGSSTRDPDMEIRKIKVSGVQNLADSSFSFGSMDLWDRDGELHKLEEISRKVWRTRAFGDFWSHMLVAEGAVDFSAESDLKIYDWAALVPILREAGGHLTDRAGALSPATTNIVSTNDLLQAQVLGLLNS